METSYSWDINQFFPQKFQAHLLQSLNIAQETDYLSNKYSAAYATCILDDKYDNVNIKCVAFNWQHLILDQQYDVNAVLSKNGRLFDGSLGVYPQQKIHIDLKRGAKLVHHHAFHVPHCIEKHSKRINLASHGASKWVPQAYIIPKTIFKLNLSQTYASLTKTLYARR